MRLSRGDGRHTALSRASGPWSRRKAIGAAGQVRRARGTAAVAPGQRGQPSRHGAPQGPARPRPGAGDRADHRRADHRGPEAGDQGRDRRARLRALPHLDRRYGRRGRRAALAERAVSRGRRPQRGGDRQEGRQEAGDGLQGLPAGRVAKALTAKLRDLIKQVGMSGTKIGDQVEAILKESPRWAEGTVADQLFVEWVGPAPLSGRSPEGASDLWAALRRASEASVASKRADHLSKTAVTA